VRFDHVALAVSDVRPPLRDLVGVLGGTVLYGRRSKGFRWVFLRLGEAERGMNLELLEPWHPENNDFLSRFLEKNGDAPHHLTFEVDDVGAEVARLSKLGYHPVGFSAADRLWQEVFIHPRETNGILIQLSHAGGPRPALGEVLRLARMPGEHGAALAAYADGTGEPGVWWDPPGGRAPSAVILRTVVIVTPRLERSVSLFQNVLHGEVVEAKPTTCELQWPCGARVRLEVGHTEPGRIDRLECEGGGSAWERVLGGTRFHGGPVDRHSNRGW
jgi:methylmalonyl-CoA/ethylmalonyl-CoA epimerase